MIATPQASAADAQAQSPATPPPPSAAAQSSASTAKERPVDFDREIRPILSDNCFACHGPDEQARQAKLRLDTKEGMFADRGGYQVIVAGKSAASKLYLRVSSKDAGFRMPPVYSNRSLTPQQVELIRQWIDQGAQWRVHWAFVPPNRPATPQVKGQSWPRNPIDNFVLARLESEGLKPSPEADKATLLRRVALDLTGLPPTPADLDSFLADNSPDAYEKRVDQLLNSPHYGERMAMQWLDLTGTDFHSANLEGALLTGTRAFGSDFGGARLNNAGLAEIEWEGADLRDADLSGASFHLGSTRCGRSATASGKGHRWPPPSPWPPPFPVRSVRARPAG